MNSVTRVAGSLAILLGSGPVLALTIDNDIPFGTVGHFSIDVDTGGESRLGNATLDGQVSGTISDDFIYDYFSYVDPGNNGGGFRLSGSAPAPAGDDAVSSSGSFTGVAGNTINWSVTSSIPDGGDPTMTSVFEFTAATGALGDLRFLQYLDEDVLGISNNAFFARGSAVSLDPDLLLFTVQDAEKVGVSHGGGYSGTQGLVNSTFAGWAADTYNDMKPAIAGAGQAVAVGGVNNIGPSYVDVDLGLVFGPVDVVSVLAWDVDPTATTATIVTTLGGVPSIQDIPPENGVPVPATLALMVIGFAGIGYQRLKQRKA